MKIRIIEYIIISMPAPQIAKIAYKKVPNDIKKAYFFADFFYLYAQILIQL